MTFLTDRNDSGITSVAQFAGRIWYAGASSKVIDGDDKSPNIGAFVFYSQVVDSKDKYDKCYQEADPTSETVSDLIDTDGGYIFVSGVRRVFKLVPLGNSIIVFSDNGVWQITGNDASGFVASAYNVGKVTDVSADSKQSIVVTDNSILFWAKGGIYILTPGEVNPLLQETNLTERTIQTFYTNISKPSRQNARGSYDPLSREVRWLYNDLESYNGVDNRHVYNKELVFSTVFGAFTVNTLSTKVNVGVNEGVCGYFVADSEVTTPRTPRVFVGDEPVRTENAGAVTTVEKVNTRRTSSATRYLTLYNLVEYDGSRGIPNRKAISFGVFNNYSFKDWGKTDAKATLVTGYDSFGDTQRSKRINSFVLHCKRTETGFIDDDGSLQFVNPSSVLVSFLWNFSTDPDELYKDYRIEDLEKQQGYVLPRQYIPDDEGNTLFQTSVISTKMKPRGSGSVMSIKFETEPEKDIHILGWGVTGSGAARP